MKNKTEKWEKEFENRRVKNTILRDRKDFGSGWLFSEETYTSLKQFISTLLKDQQEKYLEMVRKMEVEIPQYKNSDAASWIQSGYNRARDDIENKIRNE